MDFRRTAEPRAEDELQPEALHTVPRYTFAKMISVSLLSFLPFSQKLH